MNKLRNEITKKSESTSIKRAKGEIFSENDSAFKQKLSAEIYLEDPFDLAVNHLLGAYLCSNIHGQFTAGMITEVEVYLGDCDKACHAYPNKITNRTKTMFQTGGCAYVFFVYGLYNQFNVVASEQGTANAILIRALQPVAGLEIMQQRRKTNVYGNLTTGPGKLCQALAITAKAHDGINLGGDILWISPRVKAYAYQPSPRVGIAYAEEYKDKLWRFYIRDNPFISKK